MRVRSMCRFLGYCKNNLFVVDMGLHCIYSLAEEEGKQNLTAFGDRGDQVDQLKDPAGIVVDDYGNSIVADSGNNRLQLIDSNFDFIGPVQVGLSDMICIYEHNSCSR